MGAVLRGRLLYCTGCVIVWAFNGEALSLETLAVQSTPSEPGFLMPQPRSVARSWLARASAVLVASTLVWAGHPDLASADDRTAFLIERLKSDDSRVRGQAALQLGRTNDDAAVQPLCGALADTSDFVRTAAAAGLKRLGRASAVPCLQDRLAVEQNAASKTQIQDSIAALNSGGAAGGGGGAGGLASNPNAKYYVSLSHITNNTGRPQGEIETVVEGAIRAKLTSLGNYELAPAGQTAAAARTAMSGRGMKGYYLSVSVDPFDYSGGNLRVKVKVVVFTYPGKDLRGAFDKSASQPGVSPGDKGAENNLMQLLADAAVGSFAQSFL